MFGAKREDQEAEGYYIIKRFIVLVITGRAIKSGE
jgi:hypothetical protein